MDKLRNIKSKHCLRHIFSYIKYEIYMYKFFNYSKFYQSLLELDFKKKYLDRKKIESIDWINYLTKTDNKEIINIITTNLKDCNPSDIKFYMILYFRNYIIKNINAFKLDKYILDINIYSPIFSIIGENRFKDFFNVIINFDEIDENFISKFNALNKSNLNYSSLKIIGKSNAVPNPETNALILKKLIINNNDLKKMEIKYFSYKKKCHDRYRGNYEDEFFFNEILSFTLNNINMNNLVYLKLENHSNYITETDTERINDINKYTSLKYLKLAGFRFEYNELILNLNNLEKLTIKNCIGIKIEKNCLLKLKRLSLEESQISIINDSPFELPELEKLSIGDDKCEIKDIDIGNIGNYNKLINFNSLQKLKSYKGCEDYFLLLNNSLQLKKLYIHDIKSAYYKTLKKIISLKNLEDINITFEEDKKRYIFDDCREFLMDKELKLLIDFNNLFLYNSFLEKFPNINKLDLSISISEGKGFIKIKENPNYNIKNIKIYFYKSYTDLDIYCHSYKTLESFHLVTEYYKRLKDCFCLFSEKCDIVFQSLKKIYLYFNDEFKDRFNKNDGDNIQEYYNLYNNLDKIPNLEEFTIISPFYPGDVFYMNFIKKILSFKFINKATIEINIYHNETEIEKGNFYSKKELEKLFPNINLNKITFLSIEKYDFKVC